VPRVGDTAKATSSFLLRATAPRPDLELTRCCVQPGSTYSRPFVTPNTSFIFSTHIKDLKYHGREIWACQGRCQGHDGRLRFAEISEPSFGDRVGNFSAPYLPAHRFFSRKSIIIRNSILKVMIMRGRRPNGGLLLTQLTGESEQRKFGPFDPKVRVTCKKWRSSNE
jgi:hypothetical protein